MIDIKKEDDKFFVCWRNRDAVWYEESKAYVIALLNDETKINPAFSSALLANIEDGKTVSIWD